MLGRNTNQRAGKKERGRRGGHPVARKVCTVLAVFFLTLAALAIFAEIWAFNTWRGLTLDEIIYHLSAPLEGTGDGIIMKGVTHIGIPAGVVLMVSMVSLWRLRRTAHYKRFVLGGLFLGIAGTVIAVAVSWVRLDLGSYITNQLNVSTFIEDHYVDPAETKITFPKKKRNLIYIYLESMEMTYSDEDNGGAFPRDVIPELTDLARQNEDFSGGSKKLNGGQVLPGATYTMAAMFAQTTGLPLKVDLGENFTDERGSFNKMNTQSEFFSKVTGLGDILEDQGYKNVFMLGSNATFGGRKLYFSTHGDYELDDYKWAIREGLIPSDYYVFWGYEDQKLFSYAKDRLTELAAGDEPFNLTMLTVDTHFEDGYLCPICPSTFGENQYANVMACSSAQVAEFVKWIQQQDFYDNTTIVISGDHLTMDSDFCDDVPEDYNRRVYTAYINSAVKPASQKKRQYSTLDDFPTTLAALGAKIRGNVLGLGTNLFSNTKTLIEKYGYDELSSELSRRSKFMEKLADIDVYDASLMSQQGLSPDAEVEIARADVDGQKLKVKVSKIENVFADYESLTATVSSQLEPSDRAKVVLEEEEDGVWSGTIDTGDVDLKCAKLVVRADTGGKGTVLSTTTGDLTLKTDDINVYLRRLAENPQYMIFCALRDDGTHDLTPQITQGLADLGFQKYLPGHYRWSYYGIIWPDGRVREELSEDLLRFSGTTPDGAPFSVLSEGGLSGAGGGAGRYLTCSVKINNIEYAVKRIGLNFVIYDPIKKRVVDSVEFNTYDGLGALRLDPLEAEQTAAEDAAEAGTGSTAGADSGE